MAGVASLPTVSSVLGDVMAAGAFLETDGILVTGVMPTGVFEKPVGSRTFTDCEQLLGAYPADLHLLEPHFFSRIDLVAAFSAADCPKAVEFVSMDSASVGWVGVLFERGYRSCFTLRLPSVDGAFWRIFLLSRSAIHDPGVFSLRVLSVLESWPLIQAALVPPSARLTARERECLRYAIRGASARETADILQCAERTVRWHLSTSAQKLGGGSTIERARIALVLGVI